MNKDKLKYYLKLLNLEEDADASEIKLAYRKAAKIYHPDKSNDKNSVTFNEVKKAYDSLINLRISTQHGSLLTIDKQNKKKSNQRNQAPKNQKITFHDIMYSRKFWNILLSMINAFLIVRIGFNTVITPLSLLVLLATSSGISLLLYKKIKRNQLFFIGHFALPFLIINLLLSTNFIFSSNPYIELHYFKTTTTEFGTVQNPRESTLVELNNDAYKFHPGIRLHFDVKPLLFSNAVEFHFERGMFGIKVLKKSEPIFVSK
jgi:hypothetical protein